MTDVDVVFVHSNLPNNSNMLGDFRIARFNDN